jgi:hypothetical protein
MKEISFVAHHTAVCASLAEAWRKRHYEAAESATGSEIDQKYKVVSPRIRSDDWCFG